MRILITGGAGCLGANLVDRLVPAGHEILVIDNFATGHREALPSIPAVRLVEGSIVDQGLVDRCFDEFSPERVIHSAAAYKDPNDWQEDAATNVLGTINVVAAAQRTGVRRFVNFQTALCYGRPKQVPIPVEHPTAPFTSYGISKTAGEQYLAMSGLPYVSLRLANVTGPRLAIGPIPTFYKRLKASQKCFCSDTVRDFLDLSDFFALMDRVLADDAPTGIYNVSTGEGHTIKEVFDVVADYLGVELAEPVPVVPPGADDVPAVVLDASVTERTFGWKAEVPFAESVRRTLQWYDQYGVGAIFSHLAPPPTRG
ncbi:MAG: NAD-dependent epimerase/dehydratase family protein [Burkholderiales bacterium]|nr:NAD-dependent epimerase/dehydratase family protein [Burkholderiales bacterium]